MYEQTDGRVEGNGEETVETSSKMRPAPALQPPLSSLCISEETASKTNGGINLPQPFIDLG